MGTLDHIFSNVCESWAVRNSEKAENVSKKRCITVSIGFFSNGEDFPVSEAQQKGECGHNGDRQHIFGGAVINCLRNVQVRRNTGNQLRQE
jgi:hypothetical protein